MNTDEMIEKLSERDFLDSMYGWCYKRCSSSHDAQDLCQNILLKILIAIRQGREIESFHAFCWSVADHVYADFCEKRKKQNSTLSTTGYEVNLQNVSENPVEEWLDSEEDTENLKHILRRIAYLSKIYREVTVMYYLDQKRVGEIAAELGLTESAVKQRLYIARKTIQREVTNMEKNQKPISLQSIDFHMWGSGNPVGNDPRTVCNARQLSRHLIWLCKEKPRTASELSEMIGVPTVYVEEELEIQVRGENGQYGMLRKLPDGKYTINVVLLDKNEAQAAQNVYRKHLPEITEKVLAYFEENKERLLSFPYLNRKPTLNLILWKQFVNAYYSLSWAVSNKIKAHYSDVEVPERPFSLFCFVPTDDTQHGFGCDGIHANDIDGYTKVHIENLYCYGLLAPHFNCGYDFVNDPEIRLAIRAVDGISVDGLNENEREIAAKAIEHGWIYREDDKLWTKVLTVDAKDFDKFNHQVDLSDSLSEVADKIASDMIALTDKILPEHLKGEYRFINSIAGLPAETMLADALLDSGMMTLPEGELGAEGVVIALVK